MSEERDSSQMWGVLVKALVALALIAGAIAIGTIVMVRALGLDEGTSSPVSGGAGGTSDPLPTTALPVPGEESDDPSESPSETESPGGRLELSVSPQRVGPSERINLTGTYRGADNAELQVQRFEGGSWTDFPVTAGVSAGTYQTWIQTSRTGEQRLRMFDPAADLASNEVRVTVG